MKVLLSEATRMLKTMEGSEASEKRAQARSREPSMVDLQRQLDTLKASMKPFRLSKLCEVNSLGLLDSGATHPLRARRKNEPVDHLQSVRVTLAGDKEMDMKLTETGVILGSPGTEPIVSMGLLTSMLKCDVTWNASGLAVRHPVMGYLDVTVQDGCPMISRDVALKLIHEIETAGEVRIRSLKLQASQEVSWLAKVIDEHPAFKDLPTEIKKNLLEVPAESLVPLTNRRMRKLWKRKGVVVHLFSGANEGYTLKRALHEVGGDRRLLLELDVLHGRPESDLGPDGKAYGLLLRLALEGQIKAWIGGPPCRTRSVLRHLPVEGQEMPRPLRSWGQGEFGVEDLSRGEQDQVTLDDTLMMRYWLLYAVSEMIRKAKGIDRQTDMLMEHPAPPPTTSMSRTSISRSLGQLRPNLRRWVAQSEFRCR